MLDDHRDVAGAEVILGVPQAPRPMVVGRHGERPRAELPEVVQHEIGGGLGGGVRVETLVDQTVHAHEALGGGRHELPQTGGADLGVGGEIERRLHVR